MKIIKLIPLALLALMLGACSASTQSADQPGKEESVSASKKEESEEQSLEADTAAESKKEQTAEKSPEGKTAASEKEEVPVEADGSVLVSNIPPEEISEFYYTWENINFNAKYQRFYFYAENGKHMFMHEKREVVDDYGPATEKDVTRAGTFELTDDEWTEFYDRIKEGAVRPRGESIESGGSGPWMYLYWGDETSEYQEYSFPKGGAQGEFEEFCETLSEEKR